ncbi:NAD(P)H-binding protein [Ramlibacter sp. AN1015]|uniref:NAD(P)H-binding protein n=1 Tax=Ramlibacter sp. AN1015 TaxID=3133428 RepID=UPI0030BDEDDA
MSPMQDRADATAPTGPKDADAAGAAELAKPRQRTRVVAVAGATGLVGRELLDGLLHDASVGAVHALVRRPLPHQHPKLAVHLVDFHDPKSVAAALPHTLDEAYLALGTTIAAAGSRTAFRAIDHDANLAVARAAMSAGARRIALVSALGADARSRVFYNRVKGELEDALAALRCDALVIARPSLLVGDRPALGQPERPGERWGLRLSRALGPLVPRGWRPIAAAAVARALLVRLPTAQGVERLSSGDMQPR